MDTYILVYVCIINNVNFVNIIHTAIHITMLLNIIPLQYSSIISLFL